MDFTLRPMSTSEVLDRMFYLYKKNFVLFAGIAVLPTALALIARLGQIAVAGVPTIGRATMPTPDALIATVGGAILIALVYSVGGTLASAATVYALSMVHLGKPASIGESYKHVGHYFWRLMGIVMLVGLMIAGIVAVLALSFFAGTVIPILGILLGLVALGIGLFFIVHLYARFSLAIPACVLERVSSVKALERSSFLTKGRTGRMWLVFLLTGLINFAVASAISLPITIATVLMMLKSKGQLPLWIVIAGQVAQFLATPITTISIGLLYYDERIRKEAFDLQYMMTAMEQPGQQQAATAGQ